MNLFRRIKNWYWMKKLKAAGFAPIGGGSGGFIDIGRSTFFVKIVTVATAGTPVQVVNTSQPLPGSGCRANVRAMSANTGKMKLGPSAGSITGGSYWELNASETAPGLSLSDLNEIWVDSTVNGEKVCVIVEI